MPTAFSNVLHAVIFLLLLQFPIHTHAQNSEEHSIRAVIYAQNAAWNKGNIDEFMEAYWKNDSLQFVAGNGIERGFENILKSYKANYPTLNSMGVLTLKIISIKMLGKSNAYVTGQWKVEHTSGNIDGYFTLLFEKIANKWYIVSDHST